MPTLQIIPKLLPFQKIKKRFKIAIGGRGGSKSIAFADLLLMKAQTEKCKVGCFREFQSSIEDSVHALFSAEIDRLDVKGFDVQARAILGAQGEEFKFDGLARNPESVKAKHGFKYFWVEEAQTISYRSLKLLTPTLREAGSEIWMSANPRYSSDPFSERFIKPFENQLLKHGYYEDDLHLIIVVNYDDNPWFPPELEQERAFDEIHLSRAEYDHIWLGRFYDTVQNAIILPEWFDAAVDAHKKLNFKPSGPRVASHDPADSGDARGYLFRHGNVILDMDETEDLDVNDACDWALDKAIAAEADLFVWDADGLGLSLRRQVTEALRTSKIDFHMFRGNDGVDDPEELYQAEFNNDKKKAKTNKEVFKNKRAQYWWKLRDRFYNTYRAVVHKQVLHEDELISISSDIKLIDKFRSEICRIPQKKGTGKIQIMSKQEMLKLEITSPNMGDCGMMAQINPEPIEPPKEKIEFASLW